MFQATTFCDDPARVGVSGIEDPVSHILAEAFRLGRDIESHATEGRTNPENFAGVELYINREMAKLKGELLKVLSVV